MPPRWSKKPDPKDPEYRKLGDRLNFVVHIAGFLLGNSALWFVNVLPIRPLPWLPLFTEIWFGVVVVHGFYIFVLADYSLGTPKDPT